MLGSVTNPGSAGSGGGSGNGYLRWIEKDTDDHTSYYVAPAKYHGDWGSYSSLQLDLKRSSTKYFNKGHAIHGDIYLKNGSMTAERFLPQRPTNNWQGFVIPLKDGGQWVLGGGAKRLEDVLKNVTDFQIRSEYGYGKDSSGLDNVALIR